MNTQNLPPRPKTGRLMLKILAVPVLLIGLFIFQQAVWYSGTILGDLSVKHTFNEPHNSYRLKIAADTIGYLDLDDVWFVSRRYAYGTMKQDAQSGRLYFLYDCADNSYLVEPKRRAFNEILKQHNLVWKDVINQENIAKLKYGERLYDSVCQAK